MRAIVLTDAGPTLAIVPLPELKHGEVLIKIHANALNRADLAMSQGRAHGLRGGVGALLGFEWSGEVVSLGNGVAGFEPGERVMGSGGAFSDYAAVAVSQVLPINVPGMSYLEATCYPVALRTMHNAIVTVGAMQPGETVLFQGASSGIGLLGMQIAKAMGAASVVGSSTNLARRGRLHEFGADLAIDPSDPDWVDTVLDFTRGHGVDLAIDMISGDLVTPTMRATRLLGRIVNVGRLGGKQSVFDADLHAMRRITYTGVTFRNRTPDEIAAINQVALADLSGALADRRLRLPIDSVYRLEDFPAALARMRGNAHFGKIVLQH